MNFYINNRLNLNDVYYDEKGHIIPNKGIIGDLKVCMRPSHKEGPQIYSEFKDGKIICHNYGHGGSGWSFLFGAVERSIEQFQKLRYEKELQRDQEITIIGAGCMGLVTALTLYFRGYRKIKIIGEKFENTSSYNAGAIFEFSLISVYDKEKTAILNECFKHSYYDYKRIAEGKHPFIKYGVKPITLYADEVGSESGLSYLANLTLIKGKEEITLELGNNKEVTKKFLKFETFHINATLFMQSLLYTIKALQIPFELRKVNSFKEIQSKIIFNCSGLGAKELNNDDKVEPICGHVVYLRDQDLKNANFIIRMKDVPGLEKTEFNGLLYYIPKGFGYIGGTFLKGYNGNDEKYNKKMFRKIIDRARYVFNSIHPIKPKF